ncbi:EKC/KEOPS complex subunit TP53RK [Cephus cinctus]|uniref:non-specific serine/threonine protein kinase n=1 Tax=Cephus cinctus TaxID=211228 RepID=A0AAJ7FF02_CEPCN|nr:EKC/KEOPS complex subunit TP53RK [Cephus cinctus]XP_015588537.1 EKC/KEOPS complex subunit TP53RK [Cephus cinctus]XP_015588538.1 EKC/KEOPS complex subunit TP53RK [Cephus cinctus]XP_015588539.1 EKC/KEOPS complex subunit TP53RK [Cephus cinctus]XP_015588540.1 EKC/KEOPS complex subunit TP53RK [Cephus cinctus]XP_024937636.1 EKC/KEOPS complex subunit TP53RK [Cephus cinctus]XP_024937637.1 EKC/KEOPS complex subunit TP53RK [Cephus cinctus]XP_024937638.1 EKC/KEOPS complex subunit TP53RK [Cephus cinc
MRTSETNKSHPTGKRKPTKMHGFELLAQGAEARLYRGTYLGRSTLVKERFLKKYRHPHLDVQLTKDRIKNEARAIVRAKAAGVPTPTLYLIDFDRRCIFMEYIKNSTSLKAFIDENISEKQNIGHLVNLVGEAVGLLVAKLHSKNIIHGDLTTSNILTKNASTNVNVVDLLLIDFGLARTESTVEDKAVDLYVLERSLLSAHSEVSGLFSVILSTYRKYCKQKDKQEVINKYKEVQARGRKRLMIG